jgi:hypothetical protein
VVPLASVDPGVTSEMTAGCKSAVTGGADVLLFLRLDGLWRDLGWVDRVVLDILEIGGWM